MELVNKLCSSPGLRVLRTVVKINDRFTARELQEYSETSRNFCAGIIKELVNNSVLVESGKDQGVQMYMPNKKSDEFRFMRKVMNYLNQNLY